MGKPRLSAMPPQVATLAPLIGYASNDVAARSRYRFHTNEALGWYRTARWQALRWKVLVASNFTCAKCGRICVRKGEAHCDHKIAHRGNAKLFWDEQNLQCLCAPCHNSEKQKEEHNPGA